MSEVFAKQLSPQLVDIYWDALKDLYIEQFTDAAKSSVRHHKHFPKPAELRQLAQERIQSTPKGMVELPPADRKWLAAVNSLFLKYLSQRRIIDGFGGDINLALRRDECLRLVDLFENLEAESDPEATQPELKIRFDRAMARVPDVADAA